MVALATRPWVVVVGAGLSSPDISTWSQLYAKLYDELEQEAMGSEADLERLAKSIQGLTDSTASYWEKFGILKSAIPAKYRNVIRQEFEKSDRVPIPAVYNTLWSLPLRGVLSLNLDAFSRRSATQMQSQSEIKVYEGRDAGKLQRMLSAPHRFLYQLHGNFDNEDSWVFSKRELDALYAQPGYDSFLRTVFTQYHVVFVGVSADDIAIGSPLEALSKAGISGPEHFWITDRSDDDAIRWADAAMVERVPYPSGKHEQVATILRSLGKAKAAEPSALPVVREKAGFHEFIVSPEELAKLSTDDIRARLNGHAKYLLGQGNLHVFDSFLDKYDEMIDRSWYIPPRPTDYTIFDYTITSYSAKGAFGTVYRAVDSSGKSIALKLLKREIRGDAASLHAFRRGVEAMKILGSRQVPGMVTYQDASEIPAYVTMDWVEGPNLQTAKEAHLVEEWATILDIFVKATTIISAAHRLPEKVLHRDIRPANVMLRDGWATQGDFDVVVLDFDLATYSGAKSDSVIADGSALGYLAPEQFRSESGSRSALVDSFGLGMTLYYLAGRQEPDAYFQRDARFRDLVRRAARVPPESSYKATARRIERLIINATHDAQRERWSVDIILYEAQRIQNASGPRESPLDADLAAEEIANHCVLMRDRYVWQESEDAAVYSIASGPRVRVSGVANSFDVFLEIDWADDGTQNRSRLNKYLGDRIVAASALLGKGGWTITRQTSSGRQALIRATLRVESDTDYAHEGDLLGQALEGLTFN